MLCIPPPSPPPPPFQKKKSWNAYNFPVEKGKKRGTDCKYFPLQSMRVTARIIPTAVVHQQESGHPKKKIYASIIVSFDVN